MTHGRDCPDRCSLCLAAPVRRVELAGGHVHVDGTETRAVAMESAAPRTREQMARGGRARRSTGELVPVRSSWTVQDGEVYPIGRRPRNRIGRVERLRRLELRRQAAKEGT
jgi:hypothetical protein